VAQVGEEEVAGGFEMASSCFPRLWRVAAWPHAREQHWASGGWKGGGGELLLLLVVSLKQRTETFMFQKKTTPN
jgi:hypothetical protein